MGYEQQSKQSILNMTDNGVANIQLSPSIPPSMYNALKLFVENRDLYLFYTWIVSLFWNCSQLEGFQELIAS